MYLCALKDLGHQGEMDDLSPHVCKYLAVVREVCMPSRWDGVSPLPYLALPCLRLFFFF